MTLQAADYYEKLSTTNIMKRPPSGGNSFFTGRKTGMKRESTDRNNFLTKLAEALPPDIKKRKGVKFVY
ncbi:hypothetical protein CAT67_02935 [Acinetobacter baumannii]|nr:hypothetical protein CAT67_02935 [Acinetobacter baumannii]TPU28788.1 hypothetical protein FJU85_14540 [Acinetobacter baumannii]